MAVEVPAETGDDEIFTPMVTADDAAPPEVTALTPEQKALEGAIEGIKPETPAEDETVVEPVVPTAPTHSVELIAQATQLGIPADEIADMTKAELRQAIRLESRLVALAPKQAETAKPQAPVEEDPLAGIDEATLLPEVLGPLKKMAAKLKAIEADNVALRQSQQAVGFNAVQQRVNGHLNTVAPGVAKQFDPSTPQGQKMEHALYQQLATLEKIETLTGKVVSEEVRVRRALAALDMLPAVDPKVADKQAALEKAKEEFANGSLGTPTNRKSHATLESEIREKLKKHGKPVGKPVAVADKVEWLDG